MQNMTPNVRFSNENGSVRSDRLLSILMLLQSRGRVPAAELAGRLEVSVRTIYRDTEALSTAGVPVYAERGRHGGIALLPGYRTDMTGLTRDEARALFVLTTQGAHADLGLAAPLCSALAKVMTALPEPFRPAATAASQRILVDPAGWMRPAQAPGPLGILQGAVFADRRLRLRYRHSGQRAARGYTTDPYGLVCKSGVWYLIADHRGRPRLFRVSRVESAALAAAAVRRRPGADLASEWDRLRRQVEDQPTPVRVVIRVRPEALGLFSRIFASQLARGEQGRQARDGDGRQARDEGGRQAGDGDARRADSGAVSPGGDVGGEDWAELMLRFRAVRAARPLLAFGADVRVISPPEVRADLAAVAAAAAACHGAGSLGPGPLDAGPLGAGPLDGGPLDGGPLDGGPLGAGPAAGR
jgi:predicted DNA-binding transcriptional regulator YafY